MLAKYGIDVDPSQLSNSCLAHFVPPKSFWPDQYARQLGPVRIRQLSFVFDVWFDVKELAGGFEAVCSRVWKCAGFRPIIIVAKMRCGPHENHAMTALRWRTGGDKTVCCNSWGTKNVLVSVSKQDFVTAYFVEANVTRSWVPDSNGTLTVFTQEPKLMEA